MRNQGFYVMKYGAGRYTSIGWYVNQSDAEAEVKRIMDAGAWRGMPPFVEGPAEGHCGCECTRCDIGNHCRRNERDCQT